MEENEEDRISLGISDEEEEEEEYGDDNESGGNEKRSWHKSEARPVKLVNVEVSDNDDEEVLPSPAKRPRDENSDISGEQDLHDQEEGEIFSDDGDKSDEGENVATRDHSPPDSYTVSHDKSSPNVQLRDHKDEDVSLVQEKTDYIDMEVSLSQGNQDDSLYEFGSKDTEEIKDVELSPVEEAVAENTSIQRVKHYSSSSNSSSSSGSEADNSTEHVSEAVKEASDKEGNQIDTLGELKKESGDSAGSSSDSSEEYKQQSQPDTVVEEKAYSHESERLFEQREHPTTYQEGEVSSSDSLFRPRKAKDKDDSDGKQVLDDSEDDYADSAALDHLEITVPQRTVSKERKVKVQKKSEGLRSETGHYVEDISDEDAPYETAHIPDRSRKVGAESSAKSRHDQQRSSSKHGSSPVESSRSKEKKSRTQEYREEKRRVEGQRGQIYESDGAPYGSGKRQRRDDGQGGDRGKRYDRYGSERDYGKRRGHPDHDVPVERSHSKDDYEDVIMSEKHRAKSSQVKSQVHIYSEVSLRGESNDDDLRTKLLKKQEAKQYYDRSESKGDYSRVPKSEKRVDSKLEGKQDISTSKEKLVKKHSKEKKLKKRAKQKEEKELKKKRHGSSKVKSVGKEGKKGKETKTSERSKQRTEKERMDTTKGKDIEGYGGSHSDLDSSSGSESHRSSDDNAPLDDNTAIDEDIQLRKTGSESGNEQEYDDISSAESDLSPVPSPVELKKPPYFPAIQGCRSVEEFSWLNRIEEGTYGVVYRARDKRTDDIVALKRLKMEKEKEGFPITSLREINTLLKAQHPNIVTVREIVVGNNMDKIYIVMDYVAHDLKSLMEVMTQPFLVGEVKTLMIQLLRGVQHLHDNWILHRDIKTSNLLLSHNGILKIGDFGLAREYGSPLKLYTPIVVTLWYRAPELLLGMKEYSTAIDVWSVGCVFAELLMMKPLFPGKSEIDQLNRIFKELGTPNDKIWPGPPPFSELPMVKKTSFADHPYNVLRHRFGATLTDKGFNLLNRFLTYDPKKRITCEEALKHEYFEESPLPVDPSMFPTWPAKSEGHKVARKHNASPKPPEGGQYAQEMADDEPNLGFHMPAPVKGVASKGPGFSLKF